MADVADVADVADCGRLWQIVADCGSVDVLQLQGLCH